MPFEEGYINQLNLGSKSALEAPATSPISPLPVNEAPAGFGGQGVLSQPERVSPPDYYRASPNSLEGQKEVSTMDRILGAMINAGTKPGELPVTMKMQLATAETRHKQAETELAWRNYHLSQEKYASALEQQKKDNIQTAMGMMPNAIAQIRAAGTPEARTALIKGHAGIMKSLAPGTERIIEEYGKNPFHVGMWQAAAADFSPNNAAAKSFREIIDSRGLDYALQDPEGKALMTIMGHDGATSVVGGFNQTDAEKLHSGKMDEEDFRTIYKKRMYDPQGLAWTPQLATAMESFLDTPEGEQFMVGKGVKTNQQKIAQGKKEKPSDLAGEVKNERILKNKEILEEAAKTPGKYTPKYLASVQEEMDIDTNLTAKRTNPQSNPGGDKAIRMQKLSGGRYSTVEEAMKEEDPALQAQAYTWAGQAIQQSDKARSQAAQDVQMAGPGDASEYIDLDILRKTGRASGVKGEVSKRDLLTNPRYGKATPDQKKQLSELNIAAQSASDIFDLADKGIEGKFGEASADRLLSAEESFLNAEAKAQAKKLYPGLANYVSRREATLGKFARSVSGEVGVLTDQDVVRVRNLFAIGGDTAELRKSKRKALNQLIALNRKFAVEVLAGEMAPEDIAALKNTKTYRYAVNGIFGSVEGLPKAEDAVPKAASKSEAKPNTKAQPRGESLLERMRKE